jgi:hypothetical protein
MLHIGFIVSRWSISDLLLKHDHWLPFLIRKLEPRLGISNAAALYLLTPCEVDIEFRSSLMAFRVVPREVVGLLKYVCPYLQ